ncbi:MAG TPA: hypothetical protein VJT09_13175 [Pyrinomonadaceae bacterium]|nr:hypothetical protein [Pyrinomonadaceae bacterium]
MTSSKDYYRSDDEIETVLAGFESCAIAPANFTHGAHLLVAFSYLQVSRLTVEGALERMRAGLYRYLEHQGVERQKYNETITLFWIKRVRGFLDKTDNARTLADLANEMTLACGGSQVIYDYYTREHLSSDQARNEWVEPDIKALDFI